VIGHVKSNHRLNRSYLKGFVGDQINVLMAAAAFNFRKWMRLFFCVIFFTAIEAANGDVNAL
jgi:IS5 family transposase